MSELLVGKVQAALGDAARWLKLLNAAYSEKLGMVVFPGSLNNLRDHFGLQDGDVVEMRVPASRVHR